MCFIGSFLADVVVFADTHCDPRCSQRVGVRLLPECLEPGCVGLAHLVVATGYFDSLAGFHTVLFLSGGHAMRRVGSR